MALLQRVSAICGGDCKVVQHSDGSVHVMHCPYWSPRASTLLHYDCPGAVISVQSSVSSLSGFVVVVRQHAVDAASGWRLFGSCIAAAAVFVVIWQTQSNDCTLFFRNFSMVLLSGLKLSGLSGLNITSPASS